MDSRKRLEKTKIKYPIGFKLVTIITILILLSLSLITFLVSVMVSSDVRITAEDNNLNINSRSAAEAENSLNSIRSNALVLLDTLNAAGSSPALSRQAAAFFFERNQDIAAIVVAAAPQKSEETENSAPSALPSSPSAPNSSLFLINHRFFLSNEADSSLVQDFLAAQSSAVERAAQGEAIILNGAPAFGIPLLVMFHPWHPWQEGGAGAAAVFFSSESLSGTFETGANSSFMINGDGEVLVHPEHELVMAGAGLENQGFIQAMRANTRNSMQSLYTGEDGRRYFGAFTKLSMAGAAVITTIEYEVVFEGIAATTRRNIYLTAAVVFASVIFIWIFSKTISGPLKALAGAAELIEGGQFEVALKSKTRDEIGALTESFGRMSAALGVFGRFTNREIAVRAMRGEIKPGGLPKNATVFFSDIRAFTAKSENFTKEYGDEASDRIVQWLNDYFTRMVECVEKTGGVVDKFIGDAVMAHWGTAYTAGSPEEDALNGVTAALMMRGALLEMNSGRRADDPRNPPIRIGCGINSGVVTAGQIGSERRMEYTVIGDPVNLASRTEALNKPMGTDILITENTWNLMGNHLITEEMPPVKVKGKEKPIRLFAVINMKGKEELGVKRGEGGVKGPRTLGELRELLGIPAPDLAAVDTGAEEKKYKIGGEG
ncbi:MAG: HAMP domain-containing protein [Treponema sp.]|jgi:adenylate cyclase|nr:HAMP domain-containing protein [Treponema sp.]